MKDYHNKLFSYAYNILGSAEDAKDAVQDVLVKYHSIEKSHIENEMGYLIKSVTNQSINIKKKQQKRMGDLLWLPEPIFTEDIESSIDHKTIISYSILVLLEHLTAKERAVFILKHAFEYSHKEIAIVIDTTIENSRKLLSRANKKIDTSKPNRLDKEVSFGISAMKHYIDAIKEGDVLRLEKMLSKDIALTADGGKTVNVVREFTSGVFAVRKLLLYVYQTYQANASIRIRKVNHQPALCFYQDGKLQNCQVFEWEDNEIKSMYAIIDPEKLKAIS